GGLWSVSVNRRDLEPGYEKAHFDDIRGEGILSRYGAHDPLHEIEGLLLLPAEIRLRLDEPANAPQLAELGGLITGGYVAPVAFHEIDDGIEHGIPNEVEIRCPGFQVLLAAVARASDRVQEAIGQGSLEHDGGQPCYQRARDSRIDHAKGL